ncbi:ORF6N domain-containing protein [Flavihumibacter petaseus]|uniref:KilA-N DNA-binding domain-containing protein n=1 Tax=Flavihumibacter petaseus NBRC 106054 TaxID=1220578 RepID=A0A0E9MYZ4_9BACT|nr:ORF6N domain-containing protein [Flavihumibacter petaseus]GAO42753.1 hypothetical protein FPE01S_01_17710 [Flavihumibacter petaseus NBRC 106054]
MEVIQNIQNHIYTIRGERVMLDRDIAIIYGVETKVFNQAVKRNAKRFPPDFMFQIKWEEYESLIKESSRSQIVTLKSGRGYNLKYLPFAFTEQGIAMLSGVLKSDHAIAMNIAIMRAFVEIKRIVIRENDVTEQFKQIKERLAEHDVQLNGLYDGLENLLDEKVSQRSWEQRERIGFKN